VFQAKIYL